MLKKTLIYLGLGPDEEYDDYAPAAVGAEQLEPALPDARPTVHAVADQPVSRPASTTVRPVQIDSTPGPGSVRAVPAQQAASASPPLVDRTRPQPVRNSEPEGASVRSAVRILESPSSKPHAMSPTSFNEAQGIGDRFKAGQAVIVNLQGVDRDLRRRLVDFASGLCYALGGKMDRVADQVYLLSPPDVVVSAADTQSALD